MAFLIYVISSHIIRSNSLHRILSVGGIDMIGSRRMHARVASYEFVEPIWRHKPVNTIAMVRLTDHGPFVVRRLEVQTVVGGPNFRD